MIRYFQLLALMAAMGQAAGEPLRSSSEVRCLPREEANKGLPVKLRGVVSHVLQEIISRGSRYYSFVLHDGSEGVYVSTGDLSKTMPPRLEAGDLVELTGHTVPGGYAPHVMVESLTHLGKGPMPDAPLKPLRELLTGSYDCQYVKVEGVVQRMNLNDDGLYRLEMGTTDGQFSVFVSKADGLNPETIVDSLLRITGTCFTFFNSRGEVLGINLRPRDTGMVEILKTGNPDPYAAPLASALALNPFRTTPSEPHRQRVKGIVTLARPGSFLYIQSEQRCFRVNSHQETPLVPGDVIEASGFVKQTPSFAVLNEAVFRRAGHTEPPPPLHLKTKDLLTGSFPGSVLRAEDYDGTLITLRGTLIKLDIDDAANPQVFFESGGGVRQATLPEGIKAAAISHLRVGSEIDITGICVQNLANGWPGMELPAPISFHLELRGPQDIAVIRSPPWWTPARLAGILGLTALAVAALSIWNITLRRKVESQSGLLMEKISRESRLEERHRIGLDLHDTLLQELNGIGMLIGNTMRRLDDPEKAMEALHMAERMVQRCSEESRASVHDLTSLTLETGGLPASIDELLKPLAEMSGAAFIVELPESMGRFPTRMETTLLRIAHEAVANAARHSGATEIRLTIGFVPGGLRLEVKDNGRGFDASGNRSKEARHFGLLGMEERALKAGGVLSILSVAGQGTTVTATFPLP